MKRIIFFISLFYSVVSYGQNLEVPRKAISLTNVASGGTTYNPNTGVLNVPIYPSGGIPYNQNSIAYGTSITLGYCVTCAASLTESYYGYVQSSLGNTTLYNFSQGSTASRFACYNLATNVGVPAYGPTIGDAAFNNVRWAFNASFNDSAHAFATVNAATRWLAAFTFANTIQFYRTTNGGTVNPNVSTSGSASTAPVIDTIKDFGSRALFYRAVDPFGAGTNFWYKSSVVANETVTISNVVGANIAIGVWADSLGASRIQYSVDGTIIGTYTPDGQVQAFTPDNSGYTTPGFFRPAIMNDAILITGLTDSTHTVQLKFLDGGKWGAWDFVAALKNPQQAAFTTFYVMDIEHMSSTGYSLTGGSAAVQDSCSNRRWNMLNQYLPAYVASNAIIRINPNYPVGHYNPADAAQTVHGPAGDDGIHPNWLGQRNIATDVIAVLNPIARQDNAQVFTAKDNSLNYINMGVYNTQLSGPQFVANASYLTTDQSAGMVIGSTTATGRLRFFTGGSFRWYIDSAGNLMTHATNLGVGRLELDGPIDSRGALSGNYRIQAYNSTASSVAQTTLATVNDALSITEILNYSSSTTAAGAIHAGYAALYSTNPALVIASSAGDLIFTANGLTEKARLNTAFNFSVSALPATTATYDLGSSSLKWNNLFGTKGFFNNSNQSLAQVEITQTTNQLALLYDNTHNTQFLTTSSGQLSIAPSGLFTTFTGGLAAAHFSGTGSTPTTGTLGTNVSSATVTGTDTDMKLVVVTSGASSGTLCKIAMVGSPAYTAAPYVVVSCNNSTTAAATTLLFAGATSVSNIDFGATISGAGTYTYSIHIMQ